MAKRLTQKIDYTIFEFEELPEDIQGLVQLAKEAMQTAYAPYSRFSVGSSVALANGQIIKGSNQENAAYPSGLCAERVALFAAKSQFPNEHIEAIAIAAKPENAEELASVGSCGNCRQVMIEYEHQQKKPFEIYIALPKGQVMKIDAAGDYLPFSFNGDMLLG